MWPSAPADKNTFKVCSGTTGACDVYKDGLYS